jgi:glutamate synthase (NADH)
MADEGVKFIANAHVGVDVETESIVKENDAVLLATGATWPRDLKVTNRNLDGIHVSY